MEPSSSNSFRSKSYWKSFNESRSSFEWYGSFEQIAPNLVHFAKLGHLESSSCRVLVPGCGNSDLSEKLIDSGLASTNVVNVDFDGKVIEVMKAKTKRKYPEMVWLESDARVINDDFFKKNGAPSSFACILDKGLLDAMLSSTEVTSKASSSLEAILAEAKKMMNACWQLLEPNGTHVIVSLLEEHVLRFIIGYVSTINETDKEYSCSVDVSVFSGNGGSDLSSPLCPFFISIKKIIKSGTLEYQKSTTNAIFTVHEPATFTTSRSETSSTLTSTSSSSSSASAQAIRGSTYVIGSRTISTSKEKSPVSTKLSDTMSVALNEIKEFVKNDKTINFELSTLRSQEKEVIFSIQNIQWQHFVQHRLQTITGDTYLEMDLWPLNPPVEGKATIGFATLSGVPVDSIATQGTPARPRYNVTIVDGLKTESKSSLPKRPSSTIPRCAVLLIPQGREHEFSFAVKEGQLSLARQADVDRLIFVCMCRGHLYASLKVVQDELSPAILTMVPKDCAQAKSIPFLAVADDIGSRFIVAEGSSKLSGAYTVEDVPEDIDDGSERSTRKIVRRLVFMSNRNAIQSEVLLQTLPDGTCTGVDKSSLQFPYHQTIAAAVAFSVPLQELKDTAHRITILGLGGGSLASFLAHSGIAGHPSFERKGAIVKAVELDPDIVRVATTHFGCDIEGEPVSLSSTQELGSIISQDAQGSGKVHVIIGDGLEYVQSLAKESAKENALPHVIIIDVDAKDMRTGLSFPPAAFVSRTFLKSVHAALAPGGVMILNLGARSKPLFIGSLTAIQNEFGNGNVITINPENDDGSDASETADLNCVVVACTDPTSAKDLEGVRKRAISLFGKDVGGALLNAKVWG